MQADEALFLYNRSGNPIKKGLVMANSVGVVDSDYYNNPGNEGVIMFAFYNFFPFDVTVKKGERIGQHSRIHRKVYVLAKGLHLLSKNLCRVHCLE